MGPRAGPLRYVAIAGRVEGRFERMGVDTRTCIDEDGDPDLGVVCACGFQHQPTQHMTPKQGPRFQHSWLCVDATNGRKRECNYTPKNCGSSTRPAKRTVRLSLCSMKKRKGRSKAKVSFS